MSSTSFAAAFTEAFQTLSQQLGVFVCCASCTLSVPTRLRNGFNKYAKPKNMHLVIEQGSQGSCEVFKPRATSEQDMTGEIRICS